jgi:hypothetical protein
LQDNFVTNCDILTCQKEKKTYTYKQDEIIFVMYKKNIKKHIKIFKTLLKIVRLGLIQSERFKVLNLCGFGNRKVLRIDIKLLILVYI